MIFLGVCAGWADAEGGRRDCLVHLATGGAQYDMIAYSAVVPWLLFPFICRTLGCSRLWPGLSWTQLGWKEL